MRPIFVKTLVAPLTYCLFAAAAYAVPVSVLTPVNTAIPDNSTTGLSSTATVVSTGVLNAINVSVALTHTWLGDLIVTLSHGANSVILTNKPGATTPTGAGDSTNLDAGSPLNFSDAGLATEFTIGMGCGSSDVVGVTSGCMNLSFIPNMPLAVFLGGEASGAWVLNVTDTAALDIGTFANWTLNLDVEPRNSVPVPATLALLGIGAAGLLRRRS